MVAKLIVIVGETASGKSALGMELARRYNGEIIAGDSWTIYPGFDIGTAKPSQEERAEIPHHLIDVADPHEHYTAAQFKQDVERAVADIAGRGKLPILVGGAGLYVDGYLYDYSFAEPSDPEQRAMFTALSNAERIELLQQKGVDLTGVDIKNPRRLIRLLETEGAATSKGSLRANTLYLGYTIPRARLRDNIERRVEAMFRRGLKKEVQALAERYGWEIEAMKGIGYREFKEYFEAKLSNTQLKRKIVRDTLELAKRQRTWFKRNRDIVWAESPDEAIAKAAEFLVR